MVAAYQQRYPWISYAVQAIHEILSLRATSWGHVPLAWRNITSDKRRLLRSTSGIMFAVLLMLLQLGFRGAFLDSALEIIRQIDGDIFLSSAAKYRFGRKESFSRRQLYAARAVAGVASARPLYGATSLWKNPQTHKTYSAQVWAFDPDQPVFEFRQVAEHLAELRQPDTALFDERARRFFGAAVTGTTTELARREIHIVGVFSLGPDFTTDGSLITSDRNFLKLFAAHALAPDELADVEFGIVKLQSGHGLAEVQRNLRRAMPAGVAVRTKDEQIALETAFQNSVSPAGPIFMLGTAIGFLVGMMISYQILYTDLSDQLPQYATLKAIGYDNGYLIRVVLAQGVFYAFCGFVPACVAAFVLYAVISDIALLPLHMTATIAFSSLVLTLGMCMLSAAVALRRVLAADPADVF